jgi:hypothetical protein
MSSAMNATKKNKKNKNPGIFGRIFGKTFKNLGWMKKKEDSPNTKIIKELDKLKPPTTNVASEIKEHKHILKKLEKDIQKDIEQETQNARVLKRVSDKVNALKDEEKRKIMSLKQEEAKIKAEKSKMRLLHKLKIPITTEKKDLQALSELPPVPMDNYPVVPSHEIPSSNAEFLEKELGNIKIPIAYIHHHTLKRSNRNRKGGKKHGKSKKCGKK